MRRLDTTDCFRLAVGKINPRPPDHVLTKLCRALVPDACGVKIAHHIVEDFFGIQRDHRLEAVFAIMSMVLPLAIGIQISTGRCLGRGTTVISSSWYPRYGLVGGHL